MEHLSNDEQLLILEQCPLSAAMVNREYNVMFGRLRMYMRIVLMSWSMLMIFRGCFKKKNLDMFFNRFKCVPLETNAVSNLTPCMVFKFNRGYIVRLRRHYIQE